LDGPTNHIDASSAAWIERFLAGWPGACILITHDRYFLDLVVTRIVEIDRSRLYSYPGNYESFLEYKIQVNASEAKTDPDLPEARAFAKAQADAGGAWVEDPKRSEALKTMLLPLAARYFLEAKRRDGQPPDPVARFHLGNGAQLVDIHWLGDTSEKGLAQAWGIMVNYLYDLDRIEENHEAYAGEGKVIASRKLRNLAATARKGNAA